ncbi:hypothetical protein GRI97_04215 [Altererythrobacter xixiisoli]|uniref:Uncharacterized protein n=1 Tax=Croceibacterium xixiisoli TaxID=1476466 RepID=A0A6I4TSP1_9SPHN|nr:hypothetical protein [Croceibacterium xixiisoli]MXO98190.1 hypothetical protein [Croceibacterium xixiisoli]
MTPQTRTRRIGWFMVLAVCTALYLLLYLRVQAVQSDIVRAERQIVALERSKVLLETEFATRSNQQQLDAWNRVDFGYIAPTARQFVENERQLASFGTPRAVGAPDPIRVASIGAGEDAPEFPRMVSPITGRPATSEELPSRREGLTAQADSGHTRIQLNAVRRVVSE